MNIYSLINQCTIDILAKEKYQDFVSLSDLSYISRYIFDTVSFHLASII
jgi:hypothetical protein